jgi:hypothetical protein
MALAVWALARAVRAVWWLTVALVAQVAVTGRVGVCTVALLLGIVLELEPKEPELLPRH